MPKITHPISASIIIPAHNEKLCISPLLAELSSIPQRLNNVEVIVVCNGCTDGSVEFIRECFPEIKVLETSIASKVNALNLGDQHAQYFPRVYVDADVMISAENILRLCETLQDSAVLAASPSIRFNTENASCWVKAYYKSAFWSDYNQFDLLSNVIVLSEQAHRKLGKFPEVMADDEYLRSLFSPSERTISSSATYEFFTPRTVLGLIKILTRARLGNLYLQRFFQQSSLASQAPANKHAQLKQRSRENQYLRMIKRAGIVSFCVFAVVKLVCLIRSTYQFKTAEQGWERDDSSRQR